MLWRSLLVGAFLIAAPCWAFDFRAVDGTTWQFTIPPGWHVIDTPEGLAEGIHVRISSSPGATWEQPAPLPGHALIVLGFWPGKNPQAAETVEKQKEKFKKDGPSTVTGADGKQCTVTYDDSIKQDGYTVQVTICQSGDAETSSALKTITTSLHRVQS